MYETVLISLGISIVVGTLIYFSLRGEITAVYDQVLDMRRYSYVGRLKEEFQSFGSDIVARIDALKRPSSEEIDQVRKDIMTPAEHRSMEIAERHAS